MNQLVLKSLFVWRHSEGRQAFLLMLKWPSSHPHKLHSTSPQGAQVLFFSAYSPESSTKHLSILWIIDTAICFPCLFFLLIKSSVDCHLVNDEAGNMENTGDEDGRTLSRITQRGLQPLKAVVQSVKIWLCLRGNYLFPVNYLHQ